MYLGENQVEDRKMMQPNKSGNEKTFQATTELLLFSYKKKNWSKDIWNDEVCITVYLYFPGSIRRLNFCALPFFLLALLHPCCPKKVTNSLLVLGKEIGRTAWLTIIIFLFSSCKKIDSCVCLDKTFNWEEASLIAFSEVKCPLNKTLYWLSNIISRAVNLNYLTLMKFTDFSFIHFSLYVSIQLYA